MHEHIAIRGTDVFAHWPELNEAAACLEAATTRFAQLDERGVGTVVDVTPANLGRDIALIEQVQASTSVNIIVATGMYWNVPLYWQGRDPDEMADAFVREIEQGIGETSVRAGIIKLASNGAVDAVNEAVLRAGARAHRRTGVPITTHAIPQELGLDQQRIFREEGVDLARTVIGHQGNQPTPDFYRQLMDAGSLIGVDNFGIEIGSPDWHDSLGPHRGGRRALRGRLRGPHRARARQHVLHRLGAGAGVARGQPELDLDLHPGRDRPRHARPRHQRGPPRADARRQPAEAVRDAGRLLTARIKGAVASERAVDHIHRKAIGVPGWLDGQRS